MLSSLCRRAAITVVPPAPRPSAWMRAVAVLAIFASLFARVLPARAFTPPALSGHVVDTAVKLSAANVQYLDAKLDGYRRQTGFAVVAFVAGSLGGETIEDVAHTTFNTWGVGDKGKDNGVLLVIAPNERKVRIETGKGVEGVLTHAKANDIIVQVIVPLLKQDRFRDAVDEGTSAIAAALGGAPPSSPAHTQAPQMDGTVPLLIGLSVLLLIGLSVLVVLRGLRAARRGGGSGGGASASY